MLCAGTTTPADPAERPDRTGLSTDAEECGA